MNKPSVEVKLGAGLERGADTKTPLPAIAETEAAARRVLVIDDTLAIHEDFRKILAPDSCAGLDQAEQELFGVAKSASPRDYFTLDSAYQGQDGFKLARRALAEGKPYALAFVDIRMPPGWDGIETIAQLWSVDPELQVIISTAYSDYSWSEIAQRFGSTDHLVILKKPFDNIEVLQLTHALTKKWALSRQARRQVEALDETVKQRTEELRAANSELLVKIAEQKQAEARIQAFSELGQKLSASKTVLSAAEIIAEVADQLIGWDSCSIEQYSSQEGTLSHVIYADQIDGRRTLCRPDRDRRQPSALALKAIQEGGHLILKDNAQQMTPGAVPFGDVRRPSASILVVPIRNKAEVIGVLSIQSYHVGAYDRQNLATLQALADHCGGALDRIQAQEALQATREQLRQSQKLEAIGQLAGGVAHDFNNLLTVIRGNSELILMEPGQLQPTTAECLNQVVAAADRAAKLTRQLLAFSRKQVMQSQSLHVGELVSNLSKMLRRLIGEHIQLRCNCQPGLPLVQADPGMLEQVLVNLAVNSRDAMPSGGQLLISSAAVTLDAAQAHCYEEGRSGEFVTLSVTDSGSGIAPEHLPRIFEPFFTTKDVGKGTGLGLATVYGIVKQHRGWIDVSTKLAAGSTFTVFLPALPAPLPATDCPEKSVRPHGGTETILIVEDEEQVRQLTRKLLKTFGYTVHDAASGQAALELCRSTAPAIDLLLTDIIMPGGVTGRQLAEQLRLSNPRLKVIFTSGYSDDLLGHDTELVHQTNSRFLAKPCPPQRLLQTVREYLDGTDTHR